MVLVDVCAESLKDVFVGEWSEIFAPSGNLGGGHGGLSLWLLVVHPHFLPRLPGLKYSYMYRGYAIQKKLYEYCSHHKHAPDMGMM